MDLFKTTFALFLIAYSALSSAADGLESLEKFIKEVKTGKADFTQVVTPPAKEGQTPRLKTSTGSFEFARPGQFRFVYKKPFEQSIVADGQTLWLYDADLNQVTRRDQAKVLGASPAALVASAADLRALQAEFVLASNPSKDGVKDAPRDGLDWVLATPKTKDGQIQSVRIGFKQGGLAALEILDSFGQTSRMSFSAFEANASLPRGNFVFKVPVGADVIRQ